MYSAHSNAWGSKFDLVVKRSSLNVGPSLAILVDLQSPIFVQRIGLRAYLVLEKKIFNTYGHSDHLGQWIMTTLANFCSPAPMRLHLSLEQHWLRGEVVWNSQHFFYTNVWGPYKSIGKQTWPYHKKVWRQCMTIILATLVDFPSSMICTKIQPQGILGSGEEDFSRFSPYNGMATILVNEPQPL